MIKINLRNFETDILRTDTKIENINNLILGFAKPMNLSINSKHKKIIRL